VQFDYGGVSAMNIRINLKEKNLYRGRMQKDIATGILGDPNREKGNLFLGKGLLSPKLPRAGKR